MEAIKALAVVQQKIKAPKNQYNKFGKYSYRSCEDILEGVKPHLDGSIITITDIIEFIGERYYIKATAVFTHKSGESISVSAYAREPLTQKGMNDSQITGSGSSYARKYALNGLLLIDDTKDADSMDNSQKATVKHEAKTMPLNEEPDPEIKKLVDKILYLLKEQCANMNKDQKKLYMVGHLEINDFNELYKWDINSLVDAINLLERI